MRPVIFRQSGAFHYAAVVSAAYPDLTDETVTAEGMDFSIRLSRKYGYRSKLYIHHEVPETCIGTCQKEIRIGPFWLEVGRFHDSWLARRAIQVLQEDDDGDNQVSIGFLAPVEQRATGYKTILKFDTSITEIPANEWTAIAVTKELPTGWLVQKLNPTGREQGIVLPMLSELFKKGR